MRTKSLEIGVDCISWWPVEDEIRLPEQAALARLFLPQRRPLDEILRRPSLDERLPWLIQPEALDPELLDPHVLSETRLSTLRFFAQEAAKSAGRQRAVLERAACQLEDAVSMDNEVQRALAVLLRG